MQAVNSFEELQRQVAQIRALRLGFITNFFADPVKHGLWIEKKDCFTERIDNTLFIIKQNPSFWNIFYCSTTMEELDKSIEMFQSVHSGTSMIYDIVGRDLQCQPLVELFKKRGCMELASLVRMTRISESLDYIPDIAIRYASEEDLPLVSEYLHRYFNERTEQIPYYEEIVEYAGKGHVLVCREEEEIAGFLIFEQNATTLYLRYWFTHPDYRERKIGSRLLRRFLEEGKETKRQVLWVIRSNENAFVRYKHYGFAEEDMFDHVMQYN